MFHTYLALIRGINVGGSSLLKMADLAEALKAGGLREVRTYIQSGNVVFRSEKTDQDDLAADLETLIETAFGLKVGVAIREQREWQDIVAAAPGWWDSDPRWKHNLLIPLRDTTAEDILQAAIGLKPDLEHLSAGKGVVYQSLSTDLRGVASTSRLPNLPVYRRLTVRNYSTAQKLVELLEKTSTPDSEKNG